MERTKILGIGIISLMGITPEEVWGHLESKDIRSFQNQIPYVSVLPPARKRKADRFSDMAVYVAQNARSEFFGNIEEDRIGTIYTLEFGPITTILNFAKQVGTHDPDRCHPTTFFNTVSNACLGHICIHLRCKGASAVLMGSNNVGYSQMLIGNGAVDFVLTGAVNEYNEELFYALNELYPLNETFYCECATTLLLGSEDCSQEGYCSLVDFAECDIGGYPLFKNLSENAKENILQVLLQVSKQMPVDAVIVSSCGVSFDKMELSAVKEVFPDAIVIDSIKKYFGETLGSAFNLNMIIAALILKNGYIPAALGNNEKVKTILVTGYDVTGNYYAYLLKK